MIKTDWFKEVDTEEKAYWLGFIVADGSVASNLKQITINLGAKDSSHLYKLASIFKSSIKRTSALDKRTHKVYHGVRLNLYSVEMCRDLVDKGVFPNKSLTLSDSCFNHIPDHLTHHFIRGYFDGDGCISHLRKHHEVRVVIAGTVEFLQVIQNLLKTNGILTTRIVHGVSYRTIPTLEFGSIPNVIKFRDWLYKDATIWLERKRDKMDVVKQRGTSRYKGIHWCNTKCVWIARFMYQGKTYHVGYFDDEDSAVESYNDKVLEITGDEMRLNKSF